MRDQQSEITVLDSNNYDYVRVDQEGQKDRIRKIVSYQKSLYLSTPLPISTSSYSSCSTSSRSLSLSNRSGKLLELMKVGGTSLGRLFDMEHTSLASHLNNYSGSPITRPVLLWGSNNSSQDLVCDWSPVKSFRRSSGEDSALRRELMGRREGRGVFAKERMGGGRQKLTRKRSYRALPRFRMWWIRCRGFRMLFRLRRLKIIMCGKIL